MKVYGCLALFIILLLQSSFTSTTVLLANFKNDAVNSSPASAQPTWTVTVEAGAGSVVVVSSPKPNLPANKWAHQSPHSSG